MRGPGSVTRAGSFAGSATGEDTAHATGSAEVPRGTRAWLEPGDTLSGGRFTIEERLGAGGMSVVYRALDRELGVSVALKVLPWSDGERILLLQTEFRGLRGVIHPGLVSLYELFCDEGLWFFSMELVTGEELVRWAEDPGRSAVELASAVQQLTCALEAIHQAGWIHRDVKPSNVLVEPSGRVVLLDFGLLQEAQAEPLWLPRAGTRAFMAPEQRRGQATFASDWYALGVMLRALSGGADGGENGVPAPALAGLDATPLFAACASLTHLDPALRGDGEAARRWAAALGHGARRSAGERESAAPGAWPLPFVGRTDELAALRHQLDPEGAPCVLIHGPSGMGKSALVSELERELVAAGGVVLAGRCYERESVPFKAFDGVVSELVRALRAMPESTRRELLSDPRSAGITRIFPAFSAAITWDEPALQDHHTKRSQAFLAFRHVLTQIIGERRAVLWIDDLHWGDADSGRLLAALLSGPGDPPVRFIGTFRTEERARSPMLAELEPVLSGTREIELTPLRDQDAARLVEAALGDAAPVGRVVSEAAGSPFLLCQMVQHLTRVEGRGEEVELAHVLEAQLDRLPAQERRLLEVIALAGEPIRMGVVAHAAELAVGEQRAFIALERGRLTRLRVSSLGQWVEAYHDRIREAVVAALDVSVRAAHHAALATALEASGVKDPERLFPHYLGSGQHREARRAALLAARTASHAAAARSAAHWYRAALSLPTNGEPEAEAELPALRAALAESLAQAGCGREAAEVYLELAHAAEPQDALELTRRAADELIAMGYEAEGFGVLSEVFERVGLGGTLAGSFSVPRLLLERARLARRGLRFSVRAPAQVPRAALLRVDGATMAARGLMTAHPLQGARCAALGLRLALDAGDPGRLLRAIENELLYTSLGGARARRHAARLQALAEPLLERVPELTAVQFRITSAIANALRDCDFTALVRHVEQTETLAGRTYSWWELSRSWGVWGMGLCVRGEIRELSRRAQGWVEDGLDRNDQALVTIMNAYPCYALLADDDVEAARESARAAEERSRRPMDDSSRYSALYAAAAVECYAGSSVSRLNALVARIDAIGSTQIARVPFLGIQAAWWANCCDLRLLDLTGDEQALRRARSRARALERYGLSWPKALALQVRAVERRRASDIEGAARALREAAARFEAGGMSLLAACTRVRLGELMQGKVSEQARVAFERERVARPDRWVGVYAPGHDRLRGI
ncbi:MAG: AAA family ATPase [Polyangiaceae bacterium]|nr:AAA family ATPase [Polyangiaceae bacterium]MCW5789106.1 AAA family ATPase [Polyangiaceae bacterium]